MNHRKPFVFEVLAEAVAILEGMNGKKDVFDEAFEVEVALLGKNEGGEQDMKDINNKPNQEARPYFGRADYTHKN